MIVSLRGWGVVGRRLLLVELVPLSMEGGSNPQAAMFEFPVHLGRGTGLHGAQLYGYATETTQ